MNLHVEVGKKGFDILSIHPDSFLSGTYKKKMSFPKSDITFRSNCLKVFHEKAFSKILQTQAAVLEVFLSCRPEAFNFTKKEIPAEMLSCQFC